MNVDAMTRRCGPSGKRCGSTHSPSRAASIWRVRSWARGGSPRPSRSSTGWSGENPQDAGVWKTLARACLDGEPAGKGCIGARAGARHPAGRTPRLLLFDPLGRLASVQGRAERSRELYFAKALELEPQRVEALLALGAMALQGGNVKKAIDRYRRVTEIEPANVAAHYQLGAALMQAGQTGAAHESFRTALRLDPRLADAHNAIGLIPLAERKPSEAVVDELRRAVALRPDNRAFRSNLGLALMESGSLKEAVDLFRELVREHPEDKDTRGDRLEEAKARTATGTPAQTMTQLNRPHPGCNESSSGRSRICGGTLG